MSNLWDNITKYGMKDAANALTDNFLLPQPYQTPVFDTGQTEQFSRTHDAMLPEQGSTQSMLFPFGRDAEGGLEFAIPSMYRDMALGGFGLLGEYEKAQQGLGGYATGNPTAQEAANISQGLLELITLGVFSPTPKGAVLGSGGGSKWGRGDNGAPPLTTDISDLDDLGFYSPTERLAANLQPKGTGQQYLGVLSKGDGKGSRIPEEMSDMGLDAWLKAKDKVSRDEVLEYIGENRLKYGKTVQKDGTDAYNKAIAESTADELEMILDNDYGLYQSEAEIRPYIDAYRTSGGTDREAVEWLENYYSRGGYEGTDNGYVDMLERQSRDGLDRGTVEGAPKYQKYSQDGGTEYQEGLLTVPSEKSPTVLFEDRLLEVQNKHGAVGSDGYMNYATPDEIKELDGLLDKVEMSDSRGYQSPHYDPANIGLTTRTQSFNTNNGNSVHLMDELQSDWHQAGKKDGYRNTVDYNKKISDLEVKENQLLEDFYTSGGASVAGGSETPEQLQAWRNYMDVVEEKNVVLSELTAQQGAVPNAPAKKSWINQGIKSEITNTINDGKDYFAWTGGDIQADRYSLSRQAQSISAQRMNDGTYSLGYVHADGGLYRKLKESVSADKLDGFVGKELAEKIRKQPDNIDEFGINSVDYNGLDLEVGGEGMKGFYDKDVRKRTEKIVKGLDPNAKVEVIELDNGNKVWGVKITPEMRAKVRSEGQSLYAGGKGIGLLNAGSKAVKGILDDNSAIGRWGRGHNGGPPLEGGESIKPSDFPIKDKHGVSFEHNGQEIINDIKNIPSARSVVGDDPIPLGGRFTNVKSKQAGILGDHRSTRIPSDELNTPENISIEDLLGTEIHAIVGDNTGRHTVTGVNGQIFENPVEAKAGFQYTDIDGQGYAGAKTATNSKFNEASKSENPRYVGILMGEQSGDFAQHTNDIYGEMFRNAPIAKGDVPKVDDYIRNIGMSKTVPLRDNSGKILKKKDGSNRTKSITVRPFTNFTSITEPDAVKNYLNNLPSGSQRAAFIKGLDKANMQKLGVPNSGDARLAASDKNLIGKDWGTAGYRVIEPDIAKGTYDTTLKQSTTYDTGIDKVGNSQTLMHDNEGIPANLLFDDLSEGQRAKGTGGGLLMNSADYKVLESSPKKAKQLITDKNVDIISNFVEIEKTHGRKASLEYANQLLSGGKITSQLIEAAKKANAPKWVIAAMTGVTGAGLLSEPTENEQQPKGILEY